MGKVQISKEKNRNPQEQNRIGQILMGKSGNKIGKKLDLGRIPGNKLDLGRIPGNKLDLT